MKYALQETIGPYKDYYAYADGLVCQKLTHAKVFDTLTEITDFVKHNGHWLTTYETIAVTDAELFKAKLANR